MRRFVSAVDAPASLLARFSLLCLVFIVSMAKSEEEQVEQKMEGWYTVTGPRVLRPNTNYSCLVSVLPSAAADATQVTVQISGGNESSPYSVRETLLVQPLQPTTFTLQVGELPERKYNLSVEGSGGARFSNRTELEVHSKSTSVLVQTDRAVYKAGSTVRFRVLVLGPSLRPSSASPLHVYITDGDRNRVKEWKDAKAEGGVMSGEMALSEHPVLGDWKVHAAVPGAKVTKSFQVEEYVLPKFQVLVEPPRHVYYEDHALLPVTIRARYTHGGSVKGEAVVSVKPKYYWKGITHTLPINGEAVIKLDLNELELGKLYYERDIEVSASVEEELTGKKQNGTGEFTLHHEKYKLQGQVKRFYKPGLPFQAQLEVSQIDGTPVTDSEEPVTFVVSEGWGNQGNSTTEESYLTNGVASFTVTPLSNSTSITIRGVYRNISHWMGSVDPSKSPSNSFIQASVATQHPAVGGEADVEVELTEETDWVQYEVLGRLGLVSSGKLGLQPGETRGNFSFPVSQGMAPKSTLLVYYVKPSGEIVADSVQLDIGYTLPNYVKVVSSVATTEPGQSLSLDIEARPNSTVSLLGLDLSSVLLRKGNDIDKESVVAELKSYGDKDNSQSPFKWRGWHPNYNTAFNIFEEAEVFILTNATVYEHKEEIRPVYFNMLEDSVSGFGGAAPVPMAAPMGGRPAVLFGSPGAMARPSGSLNKVSMESAFLVPPKPKLRTKFPETWIWQDVHTDSSGKGQLAKAVPDTITSWVVTAFSINSADGLGLIDEPTTIKVWRPFFVSVDLPYSVIRGETVRVPVLVFNYLDTDLQVDVTLENPDKHFEFGEDTNSISDKPGKVDSKTERLVVKPNTGERTSFDITATKLGFIGIKVSARSSLAADAVHRKLLVKAEGETQYKNEAVLVDLRKTDTFHHNFSIDIPDFFVPGSAHVEVSAVGDILGTSMSNLERLVRMPFGCGEQNMLNFVPNIVVLDYLKSSRQLTPEIERRCLKYMESGYQRELSYKHHDGSFSAFGQSDPSGSTWLTAFVVKSFAAALPHMSLDEKVIETALDWLASKQQPNGSFPEVGTVFHKDMQGGSGGGLSLTSFCLLAFLGYDSPKFGNTVERALAYVAEQLPSVRTDPYALAITTYALHLANHPAKETAFEYLDQLAHNKRSMKWWKKSENADASGNPHSRLPNSVDLEMSSYGLLTLLERGSVDQAVPVMTWVLSQQNSDGGFASTQDTVVALTALSKLAEKVIDKDQNITLTFSDPSGVSKDATINVHQGNSMLLQKVQSSGDSRELLLSATGRGLCVAQVSYRFNVDRAGEFPLFRLEPTVSANSTQDQLLLDICSSFVGGGESGEESNMVVMEVSLPSGFKLEQDSVAQLTEYPPVRKVELKESDTHVVLYFDKMTKEEVCPHIVAERSHKVDKSKPVPVTVYDYYDQSRRARVFYSLPEACLEQPCPQ